MPHGSYEGDDLALIADGLVFKITDPLEPMRLKASLMPGVKLRVDTFIIFKGLSLNLEKLVFRLEAGF